jgi:hypothetical protein
MRKLRKFGTSTFLTLMIIFWAIPVAVVGAISNINYLTDSECISRQLGSPADLVIQKSLS